MKKKIKLDLYEREIKKNLHKAKPVENQKANLAKPKLAKKNYIAAKKSVTIRLSEGDLEAMKLKAEKMGIPYQTYINIVIHRDAVSL
jgi:predicted DNA binding CopG/RHH family protein